jgi:hypothetical protein
MASGKTPLNRSAPVTHELREHRTLRAGTRRRQERLQRGWTEGAMQRAQRQSLAEIQRDHKVPVTAVTVDAPAPLLLTAVELPLSCRQICELTGLEQSDPVREMGGVPAVAQEGKRHGDRRMDDATKVRADATAGIEYRSPFRGRSCPIVCRLSEPDDWIGGRVIGSAQGRSRTPIDSPRASACQAGPGQCLNRTMKVM